MTTPPPLDASDFVPPRLTRADARAVVADPTERLFPVRWENAVEGGKHAMLRAFPGLWWRDLREIDPTRVPTGRTVAFGDAHVENFGYLAFGDDVRFAFNDLDDSGDVEVALDALRYFTSASLAGYPDVGALLDLWVAAFDAPAGAVQRLDDAPTRRKMLNAAEDDWTQGKRQSAVTDDVKATVREELKQHDWASGYTVDEVRRYAKTDGGSAGLDRFWAHVTNARGERDVLEFKELATPGSEMGRGARETADRLPTLRATIWPGYGLSPYHRVAINLPSSRGDADAKRGFIVRSRGMRGNAKAIIDKVAPPEFDEQVIRAQVHVLASVHRNAPERPPARELAAWIRDSLPVVVARWCDLWEHAVAEADPR